MRKSEAFSGVPFQVPGSKCALNVWKHLGIVVVKSSTANHDVISSPVSAVLNLWVATPFEVTYQISYISEIYITNHNSSKIIVMKHQ